MGLYISTALVSDADTSVVATKPRNSLIPLLDEIRELAAVDSNKDSTAHSKLLSKIYGLQLAAETPLETILRIGYQSWQHAAVRVALDLGIFGVIAKQEPRPVSAEELASESGADAVLLARIMRVVSALGLCAEVSVGKYAANNKSAIMILPQGTASFNFWADMATFTYAFGAEFWTWLKQNPGHAATFNDFMASRREGKPGWFDIYPVRQEVLGPEGEKGTVMLVDIGGNQGHDLIKLKAKYPDLQGRFVVQDLPAVVAKATFNNTSISAMEHDFFGPQPIKHAHAYHFRAIFHDWPDAKCIQILKQTACAMKPGFSKLLISEFVLADTETALFPASLDLQMMGLHAGMERTERQWRALLGEAGLEVVRIWRKAVGEESVIEAKLC